MDGIKDALQAARKLLGVVEAKLDTEGPPMLIKDKVFDAGNLDDGIYKDAAREGKTVTEFLTDREYEKGFTEPDGSVSPYFGKNQREISEIRVKARLRGETPAMTVVEKQMFHHGVSRHDTVNKFFTASSSLTTLFPELIVQDVQDSLILGGLVNQLVVDRISIPFTDKTLRAWKIEDSANDQDALQLRHVAKGTELPKTNVALSERALQLSKHGRMLQMAYEDMAGMTINLFSRVMRRIGLRINVDATDTLISTLQSGDSTSGAPTNVVNPAATGIVSLADLLKFWSALPAPFQMDALIGRKAGLLTYFTSLANFAGTASGFQRTQETPYRRPGEFEWDRAVLAADKFIAIDRSQAITWFESPVLTEEGKIIRKQINEATIAQISGAKIEELGAIAIIDIEF